jgi:hypothetical protein
VRTISRVSQRDRRQLIKTPATRQAGQASRAQAKTKGCMDTVIRIPIRESQSPRAIITWPQGLESAPIVLPLGETAEQSEAIDALLKRALCGADGR